MPTIFTHALLPLIAAAAVPRIPKPLIAAGMIAAILPDADVVGRYFDVPHTADFGHRGATHTMVFALLVGSLGAASARGLQTGRALAFLFMWASTLSHALTDMLTDGGKGIMLLWPFDPARLKFPFHPVQVSPVGWKALEDDRIWPVLLSEFFWLVLPATLLAFLCRLTVNSRLRRAH